MAPRSRVSVVLLALVAACASLSGCRSAATARASAWDLARPRPEPPPRPAPCTTVEPGMLGQALLDAEDGSSLCLADGRHEGPVVVDRRLTLWGTRAAVVASTGAGTTVSATGAGAGLLGFTVDGSGGRFDLLDSAVHVTADDVRVEGVHVRNAVFGILVERCRRPAILANEVDGAGRGPFGLRGDGVRLWEAHDGRVEDNHVRGGRDVVVWYSSGNHLARNAVERGRYGTHLMYSHRNVVEDSLFDGNVVGIFVMYSHDVRLLRNRIARSHGSAGMAIGLKESGDVVVSDCELVANTVGLYIDGSPVQASENNRVERTLIAGSQTAIVFHRSETRNAFIDNVFHANETQVRVDGGGNALGVKWQGNDFDDYRGYDFDRDGIGDVPHRLASFSRRLEDTHPDLAFFHGSATLGLVDAASRLLPLIAPEPVLVDETPRVARRPVFGGAPRMLPRDEGSRAH